MGLSLSWTLELSKTEIRKNSEMLRAYMIFTKSLTSPGSSWVIGILTYLRKNDLERSQRLQSRLLLALEIPRLFTVLFVLQYTRSLIASLLR